MLDIEALKVILLTLLGINFLDRAWLSPGPVCRNVERLCRRLPELLGVASASHHNCLGRNLSPLPLLSDLFWKGTHCAFFLQMVIQEPRYAARRLRASHYCSKGHVLETVSYADLIDKLGAASVASAPLAL